MDCHEDAKKTLLVCFASSFFAVFFIKPRSASSDTPWFIPLCFCGKSFEGAVTVLTNTGGIAATNCYLVADEATRQAVLFDAPDHTVAPLMEEAKRRGLD